MKRKDKIKRNELFDERVEFLSSGSINYNLASSGKAKKGGIGRGRILNLVGDGSAGKTLFALEICAQVFYFIKSIESKLYPTPKKVTIVYNNKEGVMDFPLVKMFGKRFTDGIEWKYSEFIEECGRDILRRVGTLKKAECLVYVADSIDAFESKKGKERVEKSIKSNNEVDKNMGMEKAKYFSVDFFPRLCSSMKGKDATIILISQVRENMDAGLFGNKYKRNCGKALDFYTHTVCWLAVVKKLTKVMIIKGKKYIMPYGVTTRAQFRRNKISTPFREAEIDILFANDFTPDGIGGIDDIGTMVKYLGFKKDSIPLWTKKKNKLIKLVYEKWITIQKKVVDEEIGKRERRYPE